MGSFSLVTAAKEYPVSLEEAKDQTRETDPTGANNSRLNSLISAATSYVELYTGRALITQTWDMWVDKFCNKIEIPKPPLQSVTWIKYLDTSGVTQTLANSPINYKTDVNAFVGYVYLAYGESWPDIYDEPNAVNIRFIAGYGTKEDVPDPIKHAILLLVTHWFENREAVVMGSVPQSLPMGVDFLLTPYRVDTL